MQAQAESPGAQSSSQQRSPNREAWESLLRPSADLLLLKMLQWLSMSSQKGLPDNLQLVTLLWETAQRCEAPRSAQYLLEGCDPLAALSKLEDEVQASCA